MKINSLEELNKWASSLTLEQIKNLSEDEILSVAMERPGHPGQFGFMLQLQYFKSQEHFAEIMHALMERLQKVDDLKVKMSEMRSPEPNVKQFSGEEFLKIGEIAKHFWENAITESPPKFAIYMGGVGSGKTTLREKNCGNKYVHFEFGEIFNAVKKEFQEDDPKLTSYASLACDIILRESLEAKKNIAIELIGDNKDVIEKVTEGMKGLGYDADLRFVHCDPAEAYKRHLKKVEGDPDYLSAYFTQEATLSFLYRQLGLGVVPKLTKE
jgi:hypothetical protein